MQAEETKMILRYFGGIEAQLDDVNIELAELRDRYNPIKGIAMDGMPHGSASVSLLCPTELWAFKWGVCRLVAQPRHAPNYGPIAQLGERSVRIREVKGSNPSRSTNLPHRFVRCGVFYA